MQNFLESATDLAGFKYKTQVFCLCPASSTVICWELGSCCCCFFVVVEGGKCPYNSNALRNALIILVSLTAKKKEENFQKHN